MKMMIATAALFAGLATAASAGPAGLADRPVVDAGLTTKVATMICVRDDRGWHQMRGSRRVTCRPARPRGAEWGWRCDGPRCGWWHRKENRWNS